MAGLTAALAAWLAVWQSSHQGQGEEMASEAQVREAATAISALAAKIAAKTS